MTPKIMNGANGNSLLIVKYFLKPNNLIFDKAIKTNPTIAPLQTAKIRAEKIFSEPSKKPTAKANLTSPKPSQWPPEKNHNSKKIPPDASPPSKTVL